MKKPVIVFTLALFATFGCGGGSGTSGQTGQLTSYSAPDREGLLTSVTNAYGPLYLKPGTYDADANTKPWSGYWYPISDTYMFESRNGVDSPLQKFDQYAHNRGMSTHAADFERGSRDLYQIDAPKWVGRCDAWAAASIAEPEPRRDRKINGVTFTVADQKALLVSTYEHVALNTYGQKYIGWGSDYQDIYPDQFHRFMQAELFENHRAFFIDTDPDVQVWNQPIWGAHAEVAQDASDPRVLHVTAELTGTKMILDLNNEDPSGISTPTNIIPPVSFHYSYDLIGDVQADGSVLVKYGRWTSDSFNDSFRHHPDTVTAVPSQVVRHSFNDELVSRSEKVNGKTVQHFDLLDEILGRQSK